MLVQFKVENYLSFKDEVTFSMVAASSLKEPDLDSNVCHFENNVKLLKSAVVYGANASGKSNLLKAMGFFRNFILYSDKMFDINERSLPNRIPVKRFKLSDETENAPTKFEIVILIDNIFYTYGFSVDEDRVLKEYLFSKENRKNAKTKTLFNRQYDGYEIAVEFKEGTGLQKKTRKNALFLSVVARFNGKIAGTILKWFFNFNIISGIDDNYKDFTFKKIMEDQGFKERVKWFLKKADLSISDIDVSEKDINDEESDKPGKQLIVRTVHNQYDKDGKQKSSVKLTLREESEGTRKYLALSGPLIDTISKGKVLFIDEFDARMHPLMSKALIKMFNEQQNCNGQLIFISHDTQFLSREFFRRDQMWFVEKNSYESSDLYSLAEFRGIRKDASLEKDYILGKYGAIPFVGDFSSLIEGKKNGK